MTIRITITNCDGNPTDKVVEVEGQGVYDSTKTILTPGQSFEGYVFDGSEYHVKEVKPEGEGL